MTILSATAPAVAQSNNGAAASAAGEASRFGAKIDHPLTVLQVLPRLESGGVERGAIEIAQAVAAAGGRALIASAGGRMSRRVEAVGGEAIQLPLSSKNPFNIYANAGHLARLIEKERVDVVHARSRAPAWSAKWAAQRTGRPFVTTYHGVYNENFPLKRRYNSVMASGDAVIAISDFVAKLIVERHHVAPETITTIPRGADLSAFSDDRVSDARVIALARAWGVVDDPRPVLLLPGRLTRWKGQTLFVEALGILRSRLGTDKFLAIIVGGEDKKGRFLAELNTQIAQLGLHDAVRMVGHCDDMPAAFKLASVAVSASLEPEAFGRVAVEAQAMGAPVVAAAHGGAMETVIDQRTGRHFEPGSASSLASALEEMLLLSTPARAQMRAAAIENVRRHFSIESMQAATLAIYEALAGRSFAALGPVSSTS
ncbi:MAG: glycosyltransferase family 4 protein [Neomegalonema sp.]|nr:glycosyltransferase family 4 protein [Neomegalonema sp.]